MSQPTHAIRTGAATEAPEPLELIAGFPMSELVVRSDPRRSGRKQVTGSGLTEGLHSAGHSHPREM